MPLPINERKCYGFRGGASWHLYLPNVEVLDLAFLVILMDRVIFGRSMMLCGITLLLCSGFNLTTPVGVGVFGDGQ